MVDAPFEPTADDAGYATVGDVSLAWEAYGRRGARPLLLVMGLGSQMVYWDVDWCRRLAARGYRVIRYDHRDIGLSTHLEHLGLPDVQRLSMRHRFGLSVEAPYTLDALADDAAGLLDALGHDEADVVGASMGGMVAQLLALRHPGRVTSLCSWMSTTGERSHFRPTWRATLALMRRPPKEVDAWAEHIVDVYRVIGSPRPRFDEADMRRKARAAIARSQARTGFVRHLAAILASPPRTEGLARLRIPTLVLHGDRDPLVRVQAGRATAAAIPGARLEIFEGVGHDMPRVIWPRALELVDTNARLARHRASVRVG